MEVAYIPKGVCSRKIDIEIEGDTLRSVRFTGGCNGNLKGIGELVRGMKVDDVISRLDDIKCGYKNTSCPAQLAEALKEYKRKG